MITVQEMIGILLNIQDQTKPLKFFHQNRSADEIKIEIDGVVENDEEVLVGNKLPKGV